MSWFIGKNVHRLDFIPFSAFFKLNLGRYFFNELLSNDLMTLLFDVIGVSALRAGLKQNHKTIIHEVVKKIIFITQDKIF